MSELEMLLIAPADDIPAFLRAQAIRELQDEVQRLTQALAMAEQVSGTLCDECGWAMKFPGEPCRCELLEQRGATYRRGAEAMREAAASCLKHESHEDGLGMGSLRMEAGIRALRLPEEK